MIGFHPNGNLKWFFMPEDKTIQGIPCKSGVMSIVGLHPDGRLKQCELSQDCTVDGRVLSRNTRIKLNPNGTRVEVE